MNSTNKLIVAGIGLAAIAGIGWYFYNKSQTPVNSASKTGTASSGNTLDTVGNILDHVGKAGGVTGVLGSLFGNVGDLFPKSSNTSVQPDGTTMESGDVTSEDNTAEDGYMMA